MAAYRDVITDDNKPAPPTHAAGPDTFRLFIFNILILFAYMDGVLVVLDIFQNIYILFIIMSLSFVFN